MEGALRERSGKDQLKDGIGILALLPIEVRFFEIIDHETFDIPIHSIYLI